MHNVLAGRFAKSSDTSIRNGTYYIPRTLLGIPTVELLRAWMPVWLQRVGIKLILRVCEACIGLSVYFQHISLNEL